MVHHSLDQEGGLRPARTPVGVRGRLVREHAAQVHLQIRKPITAGEHEHGEGRNRWGEELVVGSEILQHSDTHPEEAPFAIDAHLDVVQLVPSVGSGQKALGPVRGPLHRAAERPGEVRREKLLGVHVELASEATADLRRDNPDAVLGKAESDGELGSKEMRDLRAGPERHLSEAAIELSDDGPWLESDRNLPLVHQPQSKNDIGVQESLVDISREERKLEGDVRALLLVHQRRAVLRRRLNVHYGLEALVADVHPLRRVASPRWIDRDHGRHRVAHVADLVDRKRPMGRFLQLLQVVGDREAGHRALKICPGHYGHDAIHPLGLRDVDLRDPGVGVRAADEHHREHARKLEVVRVGRASSDETRILFPADSGADLLGDGRCHHRPLISAAAL